MRNARIEAVEIIKREFAAAEDAADIAATQGARTIATFIEKRATLNLPLTFGLDAIDLIADGMAQAIKSRRAYFEAHAQLAALPAQMGLTKAYGTACPPNEVFSPFSLSIVDQDAQAA